MFLARLSTAHSSIESGLTFYGRGTFDSCFVWPVKDVFLRWSWRLKKKTKEQTTQKPRWKPGTLLIHLNNREFTDEGWCRTSYLPPYSPCLQRDQGPKSNVNKFLFAKVVSHFKTFISLIRSLSDSINHFPSHPFMSYIAIRLHTSVAGMGQRPVWGCKTGQIGSVGRLTEAWVLVTSCKQILFTEKTEGFMPKF